MKVGIMQPYFLPYIGYFQLIASVDKFVIYDNIKYTKKGWINRNRMLLNGTDVMFSLPLKKGKDSLDVVDRELASDFDRNTLINQFRGAYSRAPYSKTTLPLLENIVGCGETNLFRYIYHSIVCVCHYLGITTEIRISSNIAIDHSLRGQDKVIALCLACRADTYINTIGGVQLYNKEDFGLHGIDLKFIKSNQFEYPQFNSNFIPLLSIIDVLMFNDVSSVRKALKTQYELI
jgi:hypothetical protein